MSLALWHWHIEVSSKCTLRCPRCARSEVPDTLINTELDLDFFKKNFTPDFINDYVEKITFCGDDGDPIYAHDFIKIIEYFKSIKNVSIVIVTNGSHKKETWWKDLGSKLTEKDVVHFSIDGWDDTSNNIYRINSDYDSIMSGIKNLRDSCNCFMVWDAIAFKFNESKLEDMKIMAKQLGFDKFQLTKSTKFGSKYEHYGKDDLLEPKNKDLISASHRFERIIENLSNREIVDEFKNKKEELFTKVKIINNIKPICHIGGKGLFINSRGDFYPCCWVANRYTHNNDWLKLGKKFNLHNLNLIDVVKDKFWDKDFTDNSFECKTKCSIDIVNKNYATEW